MLLVGLPASGKSSFARNIINLHEKRREQELQDRGVRINKAESFSKEDNTIDSIPVLRFDNVVLIDYDSITQQEATSSCNHTPNSSADTNTSTSSLFNSNELEAWRRGRVKALETLKDALITHFTADNIAGPSSLLIIMDDNFHLRSMRRDVYRTCQDVVATDEQLYRIGFSTLYFSTPLETCIQRNMLRKGKECIPSDVMNKMASVMEPPDESKPYTSFERFHCTIDNSDNTLDTSTSDERIQTLNRIDQCIHNALQSPITPKNELSQEELAQLEQQRAKEREETLKCKTQQLDQLLRKLVGAVGRVDKKRSREANDVRRSIMERIRINGDPMFMRDQSIMQHFACTMLGIEFTNDWSNTDNPLVQSINKTFEEFQQGRQSSLQVKET